MKMFHANFTYFYLTSKMFHGLFYNILSEKVSRETLSCGCKYIPAQMFHVKLSYFLNYTFY